MRNLAKVISQQVDEAVNLYGPVADGLNEEERVIFEVLKKCQNVLHENEGMQISIPLVVLLTTFLSISV